MKPLRIELYFFDGCPSYKVGRALLDQVIADEHLDATVEMIRVEDDLDAVKKKFVGSPTWRVGDVDLFADQGSGAYAMQCRVYRTPEGLRGVPSKAMLSDALKQVAGDMK